jgi:AdoMet-dependent heme synthase
MFKLKLTNFCNSNCIFCNDINIKADYHKSLQEIKTELNELKKCGDSEIILPCNSDWRDDFIEILKYSKNLGFRVNLETNGRMFCYKSFCEEVIGYIDKCTVVYCGENSKSHDSITKADGSYAQAKNGEFNLRNMNLQVNIKNLYLPIHRFTYREPNEVVIEVTPECNFNCNSCFNKMAFAKKNRKHKLMSTEYIKRIINNVVENHIKQIRFSGGEPLLRKDIFELIEYAHSKDLIIWLNTNATLISKKNIKLLEKYVKNVLVQLNGYDEKSDNEHTNTKNSFRDKIKGLKLLRESKIPIVRAGTVATQKNIDNLEKIYKIVKENKLDLWEVYRPVLDNGGHSKFDIENLYPKLIKLSFDYGKIVSIANSIPFCSFQPQKMDHMCYGAFADNGHSRIVIDPRGYAKPGYFIDVNIGDPLDLKRCWNNDLMKRIRKLKYAAKECRKCIYLEKCKGGSLYINDLESKNRPLDHDANLKNLLEIALLKNKFVRETRESGNKMRIGFFISFYNRSGNYQYWTYLNSLVQKLESKNFSCFIYTNDQSLFDFILSKYKNNGNIYLIDDINKVLSESKKNGLKALIFFDYIEEYGLKIRNELKDYFYSLKKIQAFHGTSDKSYIINPEEYLYDILLVPGKRDYDRLNNKDKVRIIGPIELDSLINLRKSKDKTKAMLKIPMKKNIILYAPTWSNNPTYGYLSSLGYLDFKKIGQNLNKEYYLIIKPHPLSFTKDKELIKRVSTIAGNSSNMKLYSAETDITELMSVSDLLITDISSVTTTYLAFDKPIIFYDHPHIKDMVEEKNIWFCGDIAKSTDELIKQISLNLKNPKRHKKEREKAIKEYLYKLDGKATDRAVKEIKILLDKKNSS